MDCPYGYERDQEPSLISPHILNNTRDDQENVNFTNDSQIKPPQENEMILDQTKLDTLNPPLTVTIMETSD